MQSFCIVEKFILNEKKLTETKTYRSDSTWFFHHLDPILQNDFSCRSESTEKPILAVTDPTRVPNQNLQLRIETDEFVSNPPFSKNNLAGVISQLTSGRNDGLKKNQKSGTFKIVLNSGTPARKSGTFSNSLVLEPNTKVWYPPHKHIAIALRCKTFIGH